MLIELDDVCRTVGLVLGHRNPNADDRFQEDLGGESIDELNVIIALEEKHGISIDEADLATVSTIRDLYHLLLKSANAARPKDPDRAA